MEDEATVARIDSREEGRQGRTLWEPCWEVQSDLV